MAKTPEIVSQDELLGLRDLAIQLGRLPGAEMDTGIVSHATRYQIGSEIVGLDFLQDWDQRENPFFNIQHIMPIEADEGSVIFYDREYHAFPFDYFFRSGYELGFDERLRTFTRGKEMVQPYDYDLESTRKGRKLVKQRRSEIQDLYKQLGEHELTREKYDSMFRALGSCSMDNLIASGEEAAYYEAY